MDLKTAYLEIAERFLIAAEKSLASAMNEVSGFTSYHSFESLGGALVTSVGKPYPGNSNRRMSAFHEEVRRKGLDPHLFSIVSRLAIIIASLRNDFLHPIVHPDGSVTTPKDVLSKAELEDIISQLKEVSAIVNRMI